MKYRADIDGLRAIAVGIVVLAHLNVLGFAGGFTGVDIFFVISGYLITRYLVEQLLQNKLSLREFYFRRARRILPMSLLVLGATTAAAYLLFNSVKAGQVALDAYWSALFLQNLHLIQQSADYFNQGFSVSLVQHYWSLAVEEQFYLVFPVTLIGFVAIAKKFRLKNVLLAATGLVSAVTAASLTLAVFAGAETASTSYFSSATRAYELGIGALLACLVLARKPVVGALASTVIGTIGFAAMAIASTAFNGALAFPGAYALVPTIGAALMIYAGSSLGETQTAAAKPGFMSSFLSLRPIVYIGRISFSIYLIHWPLIVFTQQLAPDFAEGPWFAPTIIATTILLSAAAYRFVETPTRKLQLSPKAPAQKFRLVAATVVLALLTGITSSAWAITGGTWNTAYVAAGNSDEQAGGWTPNEPDTTDSASGSATPSGSASASASASEIASASGKPTKKPEPTKPPEAQTLAQILASWMPQVASGLQLTQVPAELSPPISALLSQRGLQWSQCMDTIVDQTTCEYGPTNAKHVAVILGDSYALAIYPMVIEALGLKDWRVVGLNQRECMVSDIVPWPWKGTKADLDCPVHREWVNKYIAQTNPDLVILSDQPFHPIADGDQDSGDNHDSLWRDGLDTALQALRPLANKIVYFGVPSSQQALTDCVTAGGRLGDKCTSVSNKFMGYINQQAILTNRYNIPFINPNDWLCYDGRCPAIIDNTPVYWDGAHLTQTFAAKLAPLFRAFLLENDLI